MAEYIDREALLKRIKDDFMPLSLAIVFKHIHNAPAADVVPVVRCKYCKYSYEDFNGLYCSYGPCDGYNVPDDFFCKAGERRGTHD